LGWYTADETMGVKVEKAFIDQAGTKVT